MMAIGRAQASDADPQPDISAFFTDPLFAQGAGQRERSAMPAVGRRPATGAAVRSAGRGGSRPAAPCLAP